MDIKNEVVLPVEDLRNENLTNFLQFSTVSRSTNIFYNNRILFTFSCYFLWKTPSILLQILEERKLFYRYYQTVGEKSGYNTRNQQSIKVNFIF